MSLLEQIEAHRKPKACAFGRWVESADPKDRADIATAFTRERTPTTWIASVLASQIPGSFIDALRDHRRGDCQTCPQTVEAMNVAS